MAIEIQEKFEVEAPVDLVWQFLIDPESVVTCLPGASLTEVVDERNFRGRVKIKLGAITAAYKCKIQFEDVDAARHVLVITGEGKDPSGGTARAKVTLSLNVLESGSTEMTTDGRIDLTGKVLQVGGGMIKGVSHQLFQQFAKNVKQRMETDSVAVAESAEAATTPAPIAEDASLKVLPLLLKALVAAVANFFRRIFGGARH
ncbi:MAG: SRPBCC family protein [Myxococcales bacterium]|nr:SRPBCC family protein [Myxococcales bacterium]